jgi:uncharacterized membrane protein YvbJ
MAHKPASHPTSVDHLGASRHKVARAYAHRDRGTCTKATRSSRLLLFRTLTARRTESRKSHVKRDSIAVWDSVVIRVMLIIVMRVAGRSSTRRMQRDMISV